MSVTGAMGLGVCGRVHPSHCHVPLPPPPGGFGGLGLAEANLVSLGGRKRERGRESNQANAKRYQRGMSRTVDSLKQSGSLIQRNFCGCLMYETGRQSGLGIGARGRGLESKGRCSSSLRREHDKVLRHRFLKGWARWGCVSSQLTLKLLCCPLSREAEASLWQINSAHAVRSLLSPQGVAQHHGPWCVCSKTRLVFCVSTTLQPAPPWHFF